MRRIQQCVHQLAQDARHGLRQLSTSRGFAVAAILTLGLGIGANTVVFSVAKAVLLRPLGFEAPDRLMWVRSSDTRTGAVDERLSWREIDDIRESTHSFEALATFGSREATWERGDRREELPALAVSPQLADVLRIRLVLGRGLLPSDADEGAAAVLLISYELWQARFGGNPDVIGRIVHLDQQAHAIVGVLPPGLLFPLQRAPAAGNGSTVTPGAQAFWLPLIVHRDDRARRDARMFLTLGRLRPHVTPEAANAELAALGHRLAADHPDTNHEKRFDLVSLRDQVLGRTQQAIPMLAVAVAAVLMICCVNLANLLLARGQMRQRELAVRVALGASRGRLVQAFMVETMILALVGGAFGLVIAEGALRAVRILATTDVPFVGEAKIDGAALVFTIGISIVTAFAFGLLPALRQSGADATDALRGGARTTGGPSIRSWQRRLLVGQIAVVLVLLMSAGLLLESFRRLLGQDLGYSPQSLVAIDLSTPGFQTNEDVARWYRALHDRLTALPGVKAVGTSSSAPLTAKWTFEQKAYDPSRVVPKADRPSLEGTFVAFDYFPAMGIPLVDGRVFRAGEMRDDGAGRLVIINETAAALLFNGRPAVGGRVILGDHADRVLDVIGVVKDTRDVRLDERPKPRFYLHYAFGGAQVLVRTVGPASTLLPRLREAVQGNDPRVIIREITPMSEIVSGTVAERRFLMSMLAAYAAVSLGIAAVGIFGVVACQVAQRTKEFGVRLALGATPRGLASLVLMQAARVALGGLAMGLALSVMTNRLLASQVFNLSTHDPALMAAAAIILLVVALLATLLPAWRAARVDPVGPLRCD